MDAAFVAIGVGFFVVSIVIVQRVFPRVRS